MTFGLTSSGFQKKRYEDIKAELISEFKAAFGNGIVTSPNEPIGQIIGIIAEREALVWELMEQVYFSQYPDTASGDALDNAVALTGVSRQPATFSYGIVTLTGNGVDSITVPSGFQVAVTGSETAVFATQSPVDIVAGGSVDADVIALTAGSTQALAGTVKTIVNPLFGVDSVTNASDFETGNDRETDAELKLRQATELQQAGTPSVEGIRNALLDLSFVSQAIVVENDSDVVDGDGRAPHSIECYVEDDGSPGNDANIAQVIFDSKAAGIQTVSTTAPAGPSEIITDSQGIPHTINFSNPVPVPIYIKLSVTRNLDPNEGDVWPADGEDRLKASLLEFQDDLTIGKDVLRYKLSQKLAEVPGMADLTVQLSTSVIPSSPPPADTSNIAIATVEFAQLDTGVTYLEIDVT